MKKVSGKVGIVLVAILFCCIIGKIFTKIDHKWSTTHYVEPYCSIKYRFDVAEYKQCKDLDPNDLIEIISSEIYVEVEKQQGVKANTDYSGGIQ